MANKSEKKEEEYPGDVISQSEFVISVGANKSLYDSLVLTTHIDRHCVHLLILKVSLCADLKSVGVNIVRDNSKKLTCFSLVRV